MEEKIQVDLSFLCYTELLVGRHPTDTPHTSTSCMCHPKQECSSSCSLVLLMKLQVYCEYIPVLVSTCREITVKEWEASGLSDTTFRRWQQAHRPKLIFHAPSQPKEAFHYQVLAEHFPAFQMEVHGIGSSPLISETSFTLLQVTRQNFSLLELSGSLHPT